MAIIVDAEKISQVKIRKSRTKYIDDSETNGRTFWSSANFRKDFAGAVFLDVIIKSISVACKNDLFLSNAKVFDIVDALNFSDVIDNFKLQNCKVTSKL